MNDRYRCMVHVIVCTSSKEVWKQSFTWSKWIVPIFRTTYYEEEVTRWSHCDNGDKDTWYVFEYMSFVKARVCLCFMIQMCMNVHAYLCKVHWTKHIRLYMSAQKRLWTHMILAFDERCTPRGICMYGRIDSNGGL